MGPSVFAFRQLTAQRPAQQKVGSGRLIIAAAIVVLAIAVLLSQPRAAVISAAQPWPSDGIVGLAQRSRPVLLRGDTLPSYAWAAHRLWQDLNYLESLLARSPLHGVWQRPLAAAAADRQASERSFVYFSHRGGSFGMRAPLDASRATAAVAEHELLSFSDFRRHAATGALLYCSHELDALGAMVLADAQPLELFNLARANASLVDESSGYATRSAVKRTDALLWIGAGRPVTHAHYDTSHNVFVQVVGRKHFVLWPPSSLTSTLTLYPSRHSLHRQSSLRAPAEEAAAEVALRVTLGPGDALYVPPYWAHHVSALDNLSLSIAVWSDSEAMRRKDSLETLPLPWEPEWSSSEVAVAASCYVRQVLVGVHGGDVAAGRHALRRLLLNRYEALRRPPESAAHDGLLLSPMSEVIDEATGAALDGASTSGGASPTREAGAAPASLLAPLRASCAARTATSPKRRAELEEHVAAHAIRTAQAVRAVSADAAICEVAMADYFEALAAFVTQNRGLIHGFLSICVLGAWDATPDPA